jgi:hypothetical protein
MFCGTPDYVPTEEERAEARQRILQFRAWVLGYPDPRERISLPDAQPQPQPKPQPETPSAPEPGPAGTRTPPARPRRPRRAPTTATPPAARGRLTPH